MLAVLGALGVGVVSPGPSFLLVARTAVAGTRRDGLWVAVGMGVGGVLFAVLAVVGLGAMVAAAPRLYLHFAVRLRRTGLWLNAVRLPACWRRLQGA